MWTACKVLKMHGNSSRVPVPFIHFMLSPLYCLIKCVFNEFFSKPSSEHKIGHLRQ